MQTRADCSAGMESYKKEYQQLVAGIGDALTSSDIEKLAYFRKEKLSSRRSLARADTPWTGLGILRALEEVGEFNCGHPQGLAGAVAEVKREDQKQVVEQFVAAHKDVLSRGVRRETRLGVTQSTAAELDGPYPPRHMVKAKTVATASVSDHEDEDDDGYAVFIPPTKSKHSSKGTVSDSKNPSPPLLPHPAPLPVAERRPRSGSDSDNEEGYSYAYTWKNLAPGGPLSGVSPESSLSSTSSAAYASILSSDDRSADIGDPSLQDEDVYQSSRESWLTTAAPKLIQRMNMKIPPLVSMIKKHENHTLSSDLITWQLKNSSLLLLKLHIDPIGCHDGIAAKLFLQKHAAISGILTAELAIVQKKHIKQAKSSLTLFQTLVVMDMPDENTPPRYPSAVAHFPMILSHKNLLHSKLISSPCLDLVLTLRQVNS